MFGAEWEGLSRAAVAGALHAGAEASVAEELSHHARHVHLEIAAAQDADQMQGRSAEPVIRHGHSPVVDAVSRVLG